MRFGFWCLGSRYDFHVHHHVSVLYGHQPQIPGKNGQNWLSSHGGVVSIAMSEPQLPSGTQWVSECWPCRFVDWTETGAGGTGGRVRRQRRRVHHEWSLSAQIHGMLHQRNAASLPTRAQHGPSNQWRHGIGCLQNTSRHQRHASISGPSSQPGILSRPLDFRPGSLPRRSERRTTSLRFHSLQCRTQKLRRSVLVHQCPPAAPPQSHPLPPIVFHFTPISHLFQSPFISFIYPNSFISIIQFISYQFKQFHSSNSVWTVLTDCIQSFTIPFQSFTVPYSQQTRNSSPSLPFRSKVCHAGNEGHPVVFASKILLRLQWQQGSGPVGQQTRLETRSWHAPYHHSQKFTQIVKIAGLVNVTLNSSTPPFSFSSFLLFFFSSSSLFSLNTWRDWATDSCKYFTFDIVNNRNWMTREPLNALDWLNGFDWMNYFRFLFSLCHLTSQSMFPILFIPLRSIFLRFSSSVLPCVTK